MRAMMFFGLIVTALFGTNAVADASSQSGASICGRKMTFLVWPNGHPAMKYADFPEIRNTHIDIYLGFANTYPDSRAGGYILAGKPPAGIPNGAAIGPCLNYGTALAKPGPIEKPKTISRPAKVDCTLPLGAVMDIVDGPGRSETFILHNGNRTLASGHVTVGNVTLTVPANCKVSSPPAR